MSNSEFQKEWDEVWDYATNKVKEIFKKYEGVTVKGLDNPNEQRELRELWKEVNPKLEAIKKKHNM